MKVTFEGGNLFNVALLFRIKEQELEIQQLRAELDLLRKQTGIRHPTVAPQLPTKPGGLMPSRPSIGGASIVPGESSSKADK